MAFIKTTVVERPLSGRFPDQTESAANLELVPFYPSGIHILDSENILKRSLPSRKIYGLAVPGDTRYEAFAKAIVTVRRLDAKVLIAVGQNQ